MTELKHPHEINRDYIRLLQGMSRFIREEFAVSIRMTQEDAVEQLLHYADKSENTVLQEMAKELREITHTPETTESAPTANEETTEEDGVRYYRGVPVATDKSGGNGQAKTTGADSAKEKTKPTRVYRGQVVSG